jgi:hypothetical protein
MEEKGNATERKLAIQDKVKQRDSKRCQEDICGRCSKRHVVLFRGIWGWLQCFFLFCSCLLGHDRVTCRWFDGHPFAFGAIGRRHTVFLFPQLCKVMDILYSQTNINVHFFCTIPFHRENIYYMKTDIMKITKNDMDISSTLNLSLIPYRVEKDCRLGTLVSPFSTHLKREHEIW